MRRAAKITLEILVGALVATAALAGLAAWRLSAGPVSVGFLTPMIERALSEEAGVLAVDIDDAVLSWQGWGRLLDVRLEGVHLSQAGRPVAEVPAMAVGFSGRALAKGVIAPARIVVMRPHLTVLREADGSIAALAGNGEEDRDAAPLLRELIAPPDPARPAAYLRRVSIVGARLTVEDRASGRRWLVPAADATVTREGGALALDLSVELELGGQRNGLSAKGTLDPATGIMRIATEVKDFAPAMLADIAPALAPLAALRLPVSGTIGVELDAAWNPRAIEVALTGGEGRLAVAGWWPGEGLAVKGLRLRARLSEASRLDVEEAFVDLGGPTLAAKLQAEGLDALPKLAGEALLRNLPVDEFRRVWPQAVAPNPRRWITANLSAGRLEEGRVAFAAQARGPGLDALVPEKMDGALRFSGVSVNYITPMPKVQNVAGTAAINAKGMTLAITGGGIGNLRVTESRIAITGFDEKDQFAQIAVDIAGPVREALTLIDHQPLGYAKAARLSPADFGGDAKVRIELRLPLIDRLKVDTLDVKALANIEKLTQRDAALGKDISDGRLEIKVDPRSLSAAGDVRLAGVPLKVELVQNFLPNAPFESRIAARGAVSDAQRAALGFDDRAYLDGPVALDLVFTQQRDGAGVIAIEGGLDATRMSLPELDWSKPAGTPGAVKIEVAMAGQRPTALRAVSVKAGDLDVEGRATLAPDGKDFARIELDRLMVGRNDLEGSIERRAGGFAVDVAGRSVNLEPFMRDDGADKKKKEKPAQGPPLAVTASFERVWFAPERSLDKVALKGRRGAERWTALDLTASTAGGAPVRIALATDARGHQTLSASAADAGALLRAVDVTPAMQGGKLAISAASDDSRPGRPLAGKIEITEFRLVDAPLLARVLVAASLGGILDALRGEKGIAFTALLGDFAYADPVFEARDVRAYGGALGITAKGAVDLDTQIADLEGTIVPAYTFNSLLGRIPLLGDILVGERGGGVFAATYRVRGPLQDPAISINPLATLAPGFLRNLFGAFEGGTSPTGSEPRPEAAPRAAPATPGRSIPPAPPPAAAPRPTPEAPTVR